MTSAPQGFRFRPVISALLLGVALLASPAWAQVGVLDTSFDTDGKVTTNFGTVTATANARAVGVQKWPDGTLKRIIVAGSSANGASKQFVLEGFLPNGTLDGSFGSGGIVYQAMGGSTDQINAISIQPDGKIVAAGFSNAATVERFAVLRLTADGQIDTTFGGGDGMVLEYVAPSSSVPGDPITGSTNRGMGVATYLDANSAVRIVVVGFGRDSAAMPTPRYNVVVAKFKNDGTLDTTFANQGRLVDDATGVGRQSRGWNVAVDSSRRILVSGDHNVSPAAGPPASAADFLVVRYNENGTRDNSFSGDGLVVLNPGGQDLARAINVKDLNANAGEEIVVAGDSDTRYASYMLKSDGTLDTSYNTTGGRIDSVSSGQDIPERVLFTPTNPVKIVLAGMGENGNLSGDFMFAAARINLNGTLDTTFDGDGILNHNITAGTDWGQDAEIQPDGKLIIVGDTNAGSENFVKVARYTTGGALDTGTFNSPTGFYSVTTIVGGTSDVGNAFGVDVNGKLLVAGSTSLAGGTDFAVARYLNTGALDTTFSTDGLTQVSFGAYDYAYAVIGTTDGGLIAAGDANSGVQWGLARFNPNGSLNTGFDGDGLRTDTFGSNGGRPHAMAIDGSGRLLVAGYWLSPTGSSANMAVARYNAATGALDGTFGTGGHVSFNISGFTQAKGIALQPDGKIVLFGHVTVGSATHFAVVRLLDTGAFDNTFGGTGRVTTDLPSPNIPDPQNPPLRTAHAHAGFVQSDGRIVAAGKVIRDLGGGQTFNTFALVRYNKDGSLDTTFGTGGIKYDSFLSDSIDEIHAIFPQHDEKMLAIGTSQKFLIGTSDFAVMRYNWDNGSLDTFFDTDGKQTTPIGPVQDFSYGGYVYPATEANAALRGRLYLGGVDYSVGDFAVARFTGDSAPVNGPTAAPDLDAGSDSGRFQVDNVTNDSTPTFNVTGCVNGQTLALHVNDVVRNPKARFLCRETSAVNQYPLTFPSLPVGEGPLADATYSFRPYAMTGHGSTSPGSTITGVRIDTIIGLPTLAAPAPENVILDAESPILVSGAGAEIGANVSSNADVQIYDTVSGPDVKVGCSENVNDPGNPARPQVLLGTNAGTWSCTAQGLALGKHMVKVRQVDVAWNTSGFTAVRTFYRKATTTTVITSNANPSVYGQPVTFTATVFSSVQIPDGSVEFYLDGAVIPTATVVLNAAGQALYTPSLTLLPVGAHTLTAKFLENDRFKTSQHTGFTQTVLKADTTTSITVAPEPSVVGQVVTITYTIAPVAPGAGAPTGTVTVTDGTQQCQGTVAAGSCTITYTSPGVRNLTASYPGDSNFNLSSTAAPTAHTVNKADTTTTITSDTPDPSVVAQVVTINFTVAVVAPGAGTPTGNVTVSDGVESCSSAIAPAGTGSCTIALTTVGVRTLTATYDGDGNFNTSTSAGVSHEVQNRPPVLNDQSLGSIPENTANGTVVGTVVATDPDVGQTLTYAITLGNTNGAFAINSGTGQVTVANAAALDFETTPSFSLTVEATDNGSPIKSDTGLVTISLTDVNEAPVIAAQSRGPVAEGAANGTLVGAVVTASDPDAGQTLSYAITAGNTGGAFAIDPSTGQLTVAAALDFEAIPTFTLTVQVTDNAPTPLSSSADVTVNVTDAMEATTTTLISAPSPSAYADAVTLTATVSMAPDPRVATGTVTFKDGVTTLGTAGLDGSGQASLVVSTLSVGSHSLTAEYGGNAGTTASTSAPVTHVVNLGPTPFLMIDDVTVAEGNAGTTNMVFTVSLSSSPGVDVTVNFATSDGTAVSPSDYQTQAGTLTFTGSEVTKTITVVVNGDTLSEPDETLTVQLSGSTNATLLDALGVGTISSDELITYSIDDVTVVEGDTGTTDMVFTVTLSAPSAQTVTVLYETIDGTATAPADYVAETGSVVFDPGVTTGTITIQVNGENVIEPEEYFSLAFTATAVSDPSGSAAVPSGGGVGTITDDDPGVLGDVNADGLGDILLRQGTTGDVRVLTSTGTAFTNAQFATGIDSVRDVYYADVTGDGQSDLVTRHRGTGVVEVYASSGTVFNLLPGTAAGGAWAVGWDTSFDLYFGDVTGDLKADLVGRAPNGDIEVWPTVGNEFSAAQGGLWTYGWHGGYRLYLADTTGDGRADLIGQYLGGDATLSGDVYIGISSGTRFESVRRWSYGFSGGYELYFADVDADGDADLVARYDGPSLAIATGDVLVMRSDGTTFGWNGQFGPWTYGWGATYDLVVRDVNGDGRADFIGRHSGDGTVYVAPGSGTAFVFDGSWATGIDSTFILR
jgi:uncharacterized delta-60 repeat protein